MCVVYGAKIRLSLACFGLDSPTDFRCGSGAGTDPAKKAAHHSDGCSLLEVWKKNILNKLKEVFL